MDQILQLPNLIKWIMQGEEAKHVVDDVRYDP